MLQTSGAVQLLFAQQICPLPPHVWQSGMGVAFVLQVLPALQVEPVQQGCPLLPQPAQKLVALHEVFAPVHCGPGVAGQHGCPESPQAKHILELLQTSGESQDVPPQQGWFAAPHA